MFLALTGAIFVGGAGSAIIGGLYWKRGTTAAAWTAMVAERAAKLEAMRRGVMFMMNQATANAFLRWHDLVTGNFSALTAGARNQSIMSGCCYLPDLIFQFSDCRIDLRHFTMLLVV